MKILTIKVFGDSGWQEYSLGFEELATQVASLESAVEKLELKEGPAGKDGQDGLSAYEIACQYGFEGSEEEWLDSLHGKDGVDGIDGNTPYIGENGNWWIDGEDTGVNAGGSGEGKCDCADTVDKLVDVVSNHETRIIALEEGDNDDTNLVTDMVFQDDRFVGTEIYSDGVFVNYRPDDTTYPGDTGTKAFFGFPHRPAKKEVLATEDYVQDCIDNGHHVRIIEHVDGGFTPGTLEIYKDGFIIFDEGQSTAETGKVLYLPEVSDSGESLVTKEYVVNNFAKLSGTQTFTGPKTFESNVFFNGMVRFNNSAGSVNGNVKNHVRLFKEGFRLYNSNNEYSFLYFPNPTDGNGTIATEEYVDEAISNLDVGGGGSGHNGETIVITEGNGGSVNSAEYHSDGVLLNCEGEEFFLEFPTSKYENGILATEEYVQEQLKNIDPGIGGNFVTTDTTQTISGGKFITFSDSAMAGASDMRRVRLAKEGFRLYSATDVSKTALLYYPDVESGDGVIATREYVENYMKDQGFLDLPYEIETLDKRVSAIELGGGGGGGGGALINLNGTMQAPGQTAYFYAPETGGAEEGLVLVSRMDSAPVWTSIQEVMSEKCGFVANTFEVYCEGDYQEFAGNFMFTVFGDFSEANLSSSISILETICSKGIWGVYGQKIPATGFLYPNFDMECRTVYAVEVYDYWITIYTFSPKYGEETFELNDSGLGVDVLHLASTQLLTDIYRD